MYNVKRFLQEATYRRITLCPLLHTNISFRFESTQEARSRATAEGNTRPEDLIAVYRRRTNIDSSGKETEIQAKYFVVDSVEALSKFGADAWDRVVCVMTTGQAWQFRPYKWSEPRQLFHHGIVSSSLWIFSRDLWIFIVKGVYVTWSNDPPNPKIKDWNVTELKVQKLSSIDAEADLVICRLTLTGGTSTKLLWPNFGKHSMLGLWPTNHGL